MSVEQRGHTEDQGNLIQLLLLHCEDCPQLKQWLIAKKYLSHEIFSELVGLMVKNVLRNILNDIRSAKVFSLIADEATDVSHKDKVCVSVRWIDDSLDIYEDALELINVPKTDSATLTMCIKDCLIRLSLPLGKCRGQAYDGASNMLGHISGVATRIQSEEPSAIYVHNLCLQILGSQVPALLEMP